MEIPRFGPRPVLNSPDDADPMLLLSAWWRAVGDPMARLARLRGLLRRRLQVAVPDQRWKHEIGEHLVEILTRLRRIEGLQGLEGIDLVVEYPSPGIPLVPPGTGAAQGPERESPRDIPLSVPSISDTDRARRWEGAVARILARREAGHGF
jgi:hypothetical protein